MKKHFKHIVEKSKYSESSHNDLDFIFDDVTDEIEKSLLELRHFLKIPDYEIQAAIESRRELRKKN
ncbi:MAG: hypothetical protein H8E12_19705 [Rhodobacteraceae bacterium]|nr:hypothetical protein [Paracoccaceae bacterium]